MSNPGKKFEEDIQNSVPESWFCYRLKDSSGSWSNSGASRFTPSNMCDFFIFNGSEMFGIECKSFLGKSMPYGNLNEKKNGKDGSGMKKLKDMLEMSKKFGCLAGYLLNFRELNETYFISAPVLFMLKSTSGRKSLSLKEATAKGTLIPQQLKRTRFKYDLSCFVDYEKYLEYKKQFNLYWEEHERP